MYGHYLLVASIYYSVFLFLLFSFDIELFIHTNVFGSERINLILAVSSLRFIPNS